MFITRFCGLGWGFLLMPKIFLKIYRQHLKDLAKRKKLYRIDSAVLQVELMSQTVPLTTHRVLSELWINSKWTQEAGTIKKGLASWLCWLSALLPVPLHRLICWPPPRPHLLFALVMGGNVCSSLPDSCIHMHTDTQAGLLPSLFC